MPCRFTPLVNNNYYHIVNRGANKQHIVKNDSDLQRILFLLDYYRFSKPPTRFSEYLPLRDKEKEKHNALLKKQTVLVDILCYCLMPNHFHLLLRQKVDNGISTFMSRWQNSYARYFNTKYKRKGYFFEASFKVKLIIKDDLLWHISRYIHLNPTTSSLVPESELENYRWSSFPEYLGKRKSKFIDTKLILGHFRGGKEYGEFVLNRSAYQKKLHIIKQLLLE